MNKLITANEIKMAWASNLKNKNLEGLLKLYSKDAVFKGTYVKNPTTKRECLEKYFKGFLKKVVDVKFLKNNSVVVRNNIVVDSGRYNFKTEETIIKAQYYMVFDLSKNKIISHYSSLY